MNDARRPEAPRHRQRDRLPKYHGAATEPSGWTAADAAELDCLVYELTRGYMEHREHCAECQPGDCPVLMAWREHLDACLACRGDAPLTFGPPCDRKAEFIAHGEICKRCNPCPALRKAIEAVVEWREARELRSRAEWLRAERDQIEMQVA